jgi:indole-3-glycerol phosphate synthase
MESVNQVWKEMHEMLLEEAERLRMTPVTGVNDTPYAQGLMKGYNMAVESNNKNIETLIHQINVIMGD